MNQKSNESVEVGSFSYRMLCLFSAISMLSMGFRANLVNTLGTLFQAIQEIVLLQVFGDTARCRLTKMHTSKGIALQSTFISSTSNTRFIKRRVVRITIVKYVNHI